eukprot:m.92583 g.92583  ORF g.92583 m.92583 type:complete len:76 (+) comp8894_c5_seq1:79-306(+)
MIINNHHHHFLKQASNKITSVQTKQELESQTNATIKKGWGGGVRVNKQVSKHCTNRENEGGGSNIKADPLSLLVE